MSKLFKTVSNFILCAFAFIGFAAIAASCTVGLGSAVDVQAPEINFSETEGKKIESNAVIRDKFALTGDWKDDGSIKDIKVSLTHSVSKKTYNVEGEILYDGDGSDSGTWRAIINPFAKDAENPEGLGLVDGTYDFTVLIRDNGGHKTEITRSFIIDNTAPVIALSRPSSDINAAENEIETYGQNFSIEGQAADDNDIESLVITFYDENDLTTPVATKIQKNIAATINLDIAKWGDEIYDALYIGQNYTGSAEAKGDWLKQYINDRTKRFVCTIAAYDGAKRYPIEGERTAADDLGNVQDSYIRYSDWETLKAAFDDANGTNIKMPDLYHMKNGTYGLSTSRTAGNGENEYQLLRALDQKAIETGLFSLNPMNNPTYSISGLDLNTENEVENERLLTIQLTKGLDGISLNTTDMRVYLAPYTSIEAALNVDDSVKLYPTNSTFQKKGDGQFATKILKEEFTNAAGAAASIDYGELYVIGVEGADIKGNRIVSYDETDASFDEKIYLMRFKAKDAAPRLNINPTESTLYLKGGQELTLSGTTSVTDGHPTLTITCAKGDGEAQNVFVKEFTDADLDDASTGTMKIYNFSHTFEAGNGKLFDIQKSDQYLFEITSELDGYPTTYQKTVIYDVETPVISIDSITPVAEKFTGAEDGSKDEDTDPKYENGKYFNGEITMTISITDDDKVYKTAPDLSKNETDRRPYFIITNENDEALEFRVGTESVKTIKHAISTPTKQSFKIHTEDLTANLPAGTTSQNVKIKIYAQDTAGNIAEAVRECVIDQTTDTPIILPYNAESLTLTYAEKNDVSNALNNGVYKSVLTTGSPLQLRLVDDDGLASYTFKISDKWVTGNDNPTLTIPDGYDNKAVPGGSSDYMFSYSLPTTSGIYKCYIQIKDKYGKTSEKSFWIIATGAAPIINDIQTEPASKTITLATANKAGDAKVKFVNTVTIDSGYEKFDVWRREYTDEDHYTDTYLYGGDSGKPQLTEKTFDDEEFIPASNRAANTVTYIVKDEMGHEGTKEFAYKIDSTKPVISADSIIVPANTQTSGNSFNFEAKATDTPLNSSQVSSNVSLIEYTFDAAKADANITKVRGVSELKASVVFADHSDAFATEGVKTFYVRAIDDVGNIGEWVSKSFMYDKAAPSLSIDSYTRGTGDQAESKVDFESNAADKTFETGKEFTLSGSASDNTGISSIEIWQKKTGTDYSTMTGADAQKGIKLELSAADIDANGKWSISGLPRTDSVSGSAATDISSGGTYTYTVIVKDGSEYTPAGGTVQPAKSNTDSVTVNIDKVAPVITIDILPAAATDNKSDLYGEDSIKGSDYIFRGTAEDRAQVAGEFTSGPKTLYYTITSSTATPAASAYTQTVSLVGKTSWNFSKELGTGKGTDTTDKLFEGEKYLWVYGEDKAGNKSDPIHVSFMVDQSAPASSCEVYKNAVTDSNKVTAAPDGTIYITNSDVTKYILKGTVSDANGIQKVTVDGTSVPFDNGTWTKEISSQGRQEHVIVVYDNSASTENKAKKTTIKQVVVFDKVAPTVDVVDDFDTTEAAATKWITSARGSDVYINGRASDGTGSGLKSLKIQVDNYDEQDLPLSSTWSYKFKIPQTTDFAENDTSSTSRHTVKVTAKDNANNQTEKTYYFRYDEQTPSISFSGNANPEDNSNRNSGFTLQVNASDSGSTARVKAVKVLYQQGGTSKEVTAAGSNGTYTASFKAGSETTANATAISDGTYTFTIKVEDIAGRTNDVVLRNLTIDTVAPTITKLEINQVQYDADPTVWYNTQTIPVTVTASDNSGGTGIASIEYQTLTGSASLQDTGWSTLSTGGSAIFRGEGSGQKLYIRVKDKAGNITNFKTNNNAPAPVLLNIDTSAPDVGSTFYYQYQYVENGTTKTTAAELSTGQVFVNGTKDLIIYGAASDIQSGLASLSFMIGDSTVTPTVTYATSGTDDTMASQTYVPAPENKTTIKYWKAVITKGTIDSSAKCGILKVTASNTAGTSSQNTTVFNITFDNTPPVPAINTFTSSNTKKQPYKKGSDYYVNNTDGTPNFTLSGIASDDKGVKDVVLTIGETPITRTSTSLTEWVFADIDLHSYTETATPTVKVTVTDVAGNTASQQFTLKFDVTGPKAKHWADSNNKDIYFRIGSGVGGKYAYGTYGKDSSMEIRGTFEEEGSGLKAVYYKLYTYEHEPDDSAISAFEAGTVDADGNIAIVNESETVPYNSDAASTSVTSNFHGQIQVFNNTQTQKYLVLVAEDNAGNRAADTMAIYGGPNSTSKSNWNSADPGNETTDTADSQQKNYYSLNKDTTPPTITGSITFGAYTKGSDTDTVTVGGTVSDTASGVKSVTVRIDDGDELDATVTNGTWTKTIAASQFTTGSYTVYATAKDNAGEGNSKQISLGSITVDKKAPEFSNIRFTETEGSVTKDVYSTTDEIDGTRYYVKNNATGKSFKISGLATDNFGVESVKLDIVDTTANSTITPLTETKTGDAIKGTCEFTIGDWSGWEVASATATITVTDKAGNEITKDLNIKFDRDKPTVDKTKLTLPTKAQTESSLFTFKGAADSVKDTTSAPEKIDIAFTSEATAPTTAQVTGIEVSSSGETKGSWSTTVDFTQNSVFNTEGTKYLWIKPYDKTGNAGDWTSSNEFTYDKAAPTISFTTASGTTNPAANSYSKEGFTLEVTAADTNGVQKVEILYNTPAGEAKTETATRTSGNNKDGTYSKVFSVGSATGALADGTYNFTVKVTDVSGNTDVPGKTNTVSRSLYVDATKPDISEWKVSDSLEPYTDSSNNNWYNKNQIPLSVTVSDPTPGSGMSSVQAYVDSDSGNPTSLIKGTGTSTTWTGNIVCNTEGNHTIYIVATDIAGNKNIDKSIPIYIDTTAPVAPVFLGAGPSGSIESANEITSLLVNPNLNKPVIVYAALKDDGSEANSTGIAASDAFKQKGKSGDSAKDTAATITAFTPAWEASHEYIEGNIVKNNNTLYLCKTSHRSETEFATTNWTSLSGYDIWSYTIPTTDMLSGGINFTVEDKAGNTADYTLFQMTVDQNPPQLTVDVISDADSSTTNVTEINGKIAISGIASDENGLSTSEQMKLYYTKSTTLTAAPAASNIGTKTTATDAATKWIEISSIAHAASWKFENIDTSKLDGTNAITDGTVVRFIIVAKDKAGNAKCSNIIAAKVDQNTDRPVITITDFNISNNSTMYLQGTKTLSGSVSDDDGTVTKFEYKKGSSGNWTTVDLTGTSWRIQNLDEGENTLYFRVTDAKSTEFVSRESGASGTSPLPKITDTKGTTYVSDTDVKLTFNVVTIKPKVTNIKYQKFDSQNGTNGTWGSATNDPGKFGGNYTRFKIQMDAQSAQGISSVKVTYNNVEYTLVSTDTITTENKDQTHTYVMNGTSYIPVNLSTQNFDGQQTISIVAADTVPNSTPTEMEESIYVDNKKPVISVTNPSSSQYSSGNVIAYGETDLTYWKNIAATDQPTEFMYYSLSLNDSTTPAADFEAAGGESATSITSWKDENGTTITDTNKPVGANATLSYKPYYTPIKGGSFNWYVYFDGSASTESESHDVTFRQFLIDSGVTTQAAIEATESTAKFRTKVQAYLWIKAVDQVGNFVETKHPILIDPQGDAPSVTIDYPETDGTTLGGSVTLRGTAKDEKGTNPGVDSVWVQIISAKENGYVSTNADQTFGNADTDSAASGLKFKDTYTVADGKHSYEVTDFKPTMKDVKQWIKAKDSSNNAIYEVYTNITTTPERVSTEGTGNAWADTADGSAYYIKAKFSGSAWSLDINKNSEFNPAAGKLNPIAYRIFAKDKDKNLSSYEQQLSVFDSDNPILGALYLRQYSDNDAGTGNVVASRPYEDDMWINGTWWLYGTVTDTDGLSVLKVNNTDQDKDGGTINYKLSTTNEVDSFELEIVASDNANNGTTPHTTKKKCVINYDKKKPELAGTTSSDFNISQSIQNSNGFYTFGSQVTENQEGGKAQSGFDYLAFWFEREITGTGGKHVVFDVMRPKSTTTDGVTTNTSEVLWSALEDPTDAKGLKWKKISTTRSSTDLGKLTIASEDKNIHVGGICMISGSIYFITSVEKNTTTSKWEIGINGQPEYTTETQDVYFAIANIVNNNVESGRGTKSKADGSYGYYTTVDNDDGDHMLESVKKQGTAWTWEANINSQNMSDGDITLHYVAFDKAGNYKEGSITGQVANNAPRLASVTVWSDFNDNKTQDEGESETMYYQGKERKLSTGYAQKATALNPSDRVFVVSGNSKDFNDGGSAFMTVKDTTRFIPEIVGGNGDLYYSYKYGKSDAIASATANIGEKIGVGADHGIDEDIDNEGYYKQDQNGSGYVQGRTDLWEGITGETKKYMEIPGKLDNETTSSYSLNALDNTTATDPMWFEYTIYDSTTGCKAWTDTNRTTGRLSSTFRVALNLQYVDSVRPNTVISPLYWNSSSDNSVYHDINGTFFGHVELKKDLGASTLGSTYGTDDDKVSGKVVFRGFAYDNKKLSELKWGLVANNTTDSYTNPTYKFGTGMQSGATFNGTTWSSTATMNENHYTFEVSTLAKDGAYHNQNGHKVAWTLTLDTSYIDGVVGTDLRVIVQATDSQATNSTTRLSTITNSSVTSTANPETDPATYDAGTYNPTYKVDILPYITGVATRLSALNADGTLYGRTALGHYPIGDDETSVILKGYNLAQGNANVTLNNATIKQLATGNYSYTVSGTIATINNLNNNEAHGDYNLTVEGLAEKTKVTNMYNRQPNTLNNLTLTDDIYFDMWEFNSEAAKPRSGSLAEPVMKISPTSNMIGFAFANGPAYLSMPGTVNNQEYSYYYWQQSYDLYTALSLAYDSAGHTYGTALGADMNARQADLFNFVSDRWGKGETGGKTGSTGGTNANRLESMGQRTDSDGDNTQESSDTINFDKKRIQSVSIATSNANDTSANVYLAYYDNTNDEIRFRYGSVENSKNNYGSITDDFGGNELHSSGGDISTNKAPFYGYYDGYSYTMTGPNGRNNTCTPRSQIVATTSGKSHDNNDLLGKAGNYLSIGVTKGNNSNDVVVMVWYDQWNKKLCYAYNTNPMAAANNKGQNITGWTKGPDILSKGGEYCQLVVDGNGGIHIAAYDNGDLKYAYLSSYNDTTVDSCTVDSYDIIGQNLTIDVAKEGDNYIPHIGYYALSRTLPKYAYLAVPGAFGSAGADSTDSFTGVWECSYIPTDSTVPQDRINVGLFKESKTVNGRTVSDIRTYSTTDKKAVNANKSNIGTSTAGTENGKCYGNGTSNAVLGYVIKISSMSSYIETAQLK